MNAAAIVARGVEKRFGRAAALRGLDLEVAVGECLAVLGPNGAGKSTLLRLIAGLARPSAGTLEVAGFPAQGRQARAQIGYVGHATLLYPALTARENLIFAARLYGVARPAARADALLVEMGLGDAAQRHRPAGEYSRGMAQRLAIARGLVHDPPIVLLDEPFTGLDPGSAQRLVGHLQALRREGRTLVLITHAAARAVELADTAVVLAEGRVCERSRAPDLQIDTLERASLAAADLT